MICSINHDINCYIRGTVGDSVITSVLSCSGGKVSKTRAEGDNSDGLSSGKGKKVVEVADLSALPAIVRHEIYKYVFGNIAFIGASAEATFPDAVKSIPTIKIEATSEEYSLKFNLKEMVEMLRFKSEVSEDFCRGKTLRQLCVPFANEARLFLKKIYESEGEISNLAMKMPNLTQKAPWVAFDFNSGLKFSTLTKFEMRVIQNLNRRLLATTIKTSSAEAQESSFELDLTI